MFQCVAKILEKGPLLTGRTDETIRKNQLAAMHEATQFGVRRVKERTPQGVSGAQGGLLASIQPDVRERKTGVVGIIGTASPYGLVVEKGRRPGQKAPPGSNTHSDLSTRSLAATNQGPLIRWIEVKMGVSLEEALRIEFALRWKIAKKGTKGAFMFEKTLKEDWPEFEAIFRRHGVIIAKELSA